MKRPTKAVVRSAVVFTFVAATLAFSTPARATDVVYDSLSGVLFSGGMLDVENGQSMTLGGTARTVQQIDLRVSTSLGDEDFRVRFYNVDGAGFPTSLIWESAEESFTGPIGPTIISVDVPNVVVPDSFAWTIDRDLPSQLVLRNADLPSVGTHLTRFYTQTGGGGWTASGDQTFTFGARIFAVPEPTAFALLACMTVGLATGRCKTRANGALRTAERQ